MDYSTPISAYLPVCDQERSDQALILDFINKNREDVLLRKNGIAHITSSGFILNHALDKVLFIHHNIRNVWAWTGGHADGDSDLLAVAIREAKEETGLTSVIPQTGDIASLDILINYGHVRRGEYVSAHLHLSMSYILLADENELLRIKPDENSDIRWFPLDFINTENFLPSDVILYQKLIARAKKDQEKRQ